MSAASPFIGYAATKPSRGIGITGLLSPPVEYCAAVGLMRRNVACTSPPGAVARVVDAVLIGGMVDAVFIGDEVGYVKASQA
jgi:hypothetical protein